jgi:hypothetical protein
MLRVWGNYTSLRWGKCSTRVPVRERRQEAVGSVGVLRPVKETIKPSPLSDALRTSNSLASECVLAIG